MKFNLNFLKLILAVFTMTLIGCHSSPDFEKLESEILDFHKAFINDHLNKNVEHFVQGYHDDYIFVSEGEIRKTAKKELRSSFSDYLNNTTFTAYKKEKRGQAKFF